MINLDQAELASVFYHDIFDFPLASLELIKWRGGKHFPQIKKTFEVEEKDGFYFLKGRSRNVSLRMLRKRISKRQYKKDAGTL